MKHKGVIFDLDGTLLDSMPIWDNIGSKYLRTLGLAPAEDLHEKIKIMSLLQCAGLLREQYCLPYTEEKIMQQINALIEEQYRSLVPLKPHVITFLQRLNKAGAELCIATATDRYLVEAALERLGIAGYFKFILTCGEAGCGKDVPVIYHRALELLNTRLDDTVIFEDALYAIKSAKAAGFTVVGVHDASAASDEEAIKSIADSYIYTFEEWKVEER